MGRRRKYWLTNGTGKATARGKTLPGYRVEWNEYRADGTLSHRSRTFDRRSDARTWRRQQTALLALRDLDNLTRINLPDAGGEFLAGCQTLAKKTQNDYRTTLTALCRVTGDITVLDITGHHIDAFIASKLAPRGKATRTTNTALKHLRNLRRFFGWCQQRGYHDANPIAAATAVPKQRPAVRARPRLTMADVNRLVAHADTADRKLAILLAVTTGLDRRVIEQLSTHQIDPHDRCIRLHRPKTGVALVLPLHPAVWLHLADRLDEDHPRRPLLGGLQRQGRSKDWWNRLVERIGLEGVWFRDLKALAATLLQQHGATLVEAQHLLGHSSPEVTARHYSTPSQRIADVLGSIPLPSIQTEPPVEPD